MVASVQPEQKLKVINDSIKGKKLVNLLILSFIFFFPCIPLGNAGEQRGFYLSV